MGFLRLPVVVLAVGLGCVSKVLKVQTQRLHRRFPDNETTFIPNDVACKLDQLSEQNLSCFSADESTQTEKLKGNESMSTAEAGVQTELNIPLEADHLSGQLDERSHLVNELEYKVQILTARIENESFAFEAALEVAEKNQNAVDDLRHQLDERIEDMSALEKMCENLTIHVTDLESEIGNIVRQTELQKSDFDHVNAQFSTALEELRVKDEEFAELQDQMAELEGQNEGLAKIMARDREEGAYYVRRAQDLAGLLEGRPMVEEDKKLLEEKDGEIRMLNKHIYENNVKKEELERKLAKQQAVIDDEMPGLRTELEEKEQDLAIETSRTDAFKYVHYLKADVLRGFQPDKAVHAIKTEQNLLRTDNRHLTEKVQKLEEDLANTKSSNETSQRRFVAVSEENSDLQELIKTMKETTRFLEVDVGRLTWQLDVKTDALDQTEKQAQSTIEELEETIAGLNHEVDVGNDRIRQTAREATKFANLPAETQDQVRLLMMDDELRTIKEQLQGLIPKLTEDQATLEEVKEENEGLKRRIEDFKRKETQDILREPYEEWVQEQLQKRLVDAEAAVADLQKRLIARDEQIQSLREAKNTALVPEPELRGSRSRPAVDMGSMHFDSPPQRRSSAVEADGSPQRTETMSSKDQGGRTVASGLDAFDFGFGLGNTAFREGVVMNPSADGWPVRT